MSLFTGHVFGSAWKCKQCAIAKPIRDSGSAGMLD